MLKNWSFVVRLGLASTNANLDEVFCAHHAYRTTEERDMAAAVDLSNSSENPLLEKWGRHLNHHNYNNDTSHGNPIMRVDPNVPLEKEVETAFVFRLSFDGRNDDVPIVKRLVRTKNDSTSDAFKLLYTTKENAANFVYNIGATSVMELFESFRQRYVTCQILVKRIERAETEVVASASLTLLELLLSSEPSFTFRLNTSECAAERSTATGTSSHHTTMESFLGSDDLLLVQKEKGEHLRDALVVVQLRMDESATIEMALKELTVENVEPESSSSSSISASTVQEFCVQYGPGWVVRSLSASERNQLRLSPMSNTAASSLNGSSYGGLNSVSHFTYNTTNLASQGAHFALTTPWTPRPPSSLNRGENTSVLPLQLEDVSPVSITSTLNKFTDKFTFGFLLLSRPAPPPLRTSSAHAAEEEKHPRQTSEPRCEEKEVAYFELSFHAMKSAMDRVNATFHVPFCIHERKVELPTKREASHGARSSTTNSTVMLRGMIELNHLPVFKIVAADLLNQEVFFKEYKLAYTKTGSKGAALPHDKSDHQQEQNQHDTSASLNHSGAEVDQLANPLRLKSSPVAQKAVEAEERGNRGHAHSAVAQSLFTDDADETGLPHSHSVEEEPSGSGRLPQSTASAECTPLRTVDHTRSGHRETTATETMHTSVLPPDSSVDAPSPVELQEGCMDYNYTDYTPTRNQRASATSSMPTPPALPTPPKRREEEEEEDEQNYEGFEEEEEDEHHHRTPNLSPDRLLYVAQSGSASSTSHSNVDDRDKAAVALLPPPLHGGEEPNGDTTPVTRRIIESSSSSSEDDDAGVEEEEREDDNRIEHHLGGSEDDTTGREDAAHTHEGNPVTVRPPSPTSTATSSVPVDSPSELTLEHGAATSAAPASVREYSRQDASAATSSHTQTSSTRGHAATTDPVLVAELHQVLDTMVTELSSSPKDRETATATTSTTATNDSEERITRRTVQYSQNSGGSTAFVMEPAHAEALLAAFEKIEAEKAALLHEMQHMQMAQQLSNSSTQERAHARGVTTRPKGSNPSPPNASNQTPNSAREACFLSSYNANGSRDSSAIRLKGTPNTSRKAGPPPPPQQQPPLPPRHQPPPPPHMQSSPRTHYRRKMEDTNGIVNSPSSLSQAGPSASASPPPRRQMMDDPSDPYERSPPTSSKTPSRPRTAESYFRRSYLFRQQYSSNSAVRPAAPEPLEPHVVTQRPSSSSVSSHKSLRLGGSLGGEGGRGGEDAAMGASGTEHPYWVAGGWAKYATEPPQQQRLDNNNYFMPPVRTASHAREEVYTALYPPTTSGTNVDAAAAANAYNNGIQPTRAVHAFNISITDEGEREPAAAKDRPMLRPVQLPSTSANALNTGAAMRTAEEELFINAIEKCDVQLVEYLLRSKPHLVRDNNNLLHIACAVNVSHPLIVELLLRARPELARGVDAHTGSTALHCACDATYHDHLDSDVIKVLLLHGVKASPRNKAGLTAFQLAVLFPFLNDSIRARGQQLNKEAILSELFQVLDHLLVVGGSQFNERTSNGETALHLLCAQRKGMEDMPTMLAYLCSRGADVYATATYMMQDGQHVRNLLPIEVSQMCGEETTTMFLADYMQQQLQQQQQRQHQKQRFQYYHAQ